jgi:ribosomal protein S18 acetylase RimI-like enzyme
MKHFEQIYAPPGGCYLLATVDNFLAGGVALRKFDAGICEMKRLFVNHAFRGQGIGRALCQALLRSAVSLGYHKMRLDTLERLVNANRLYEKLGFYEIPAYRLNPEADARYMEYNLEQY